MSNHATIIKRGNERRSAALMLGTFAIWPALSAIAAFFTLRRSLSRLILVAFSAIIGYRFVNDDPRYDSYRLALFADEIAALDWSSFYSWASTYCFVSENCIDPVQPLVTFVLTRLGGVEFAFAGYAAIFALFCFNSLALVREDFSGKSRLFCWAILLSLLLINPVYNISGFRFNAATWVLFYGLYKYCRLGNKSGLLWIGVAVAFHYSMLVPIAILAIYKILPRNLILANWLALGSFALSAPVSWIASILPPDLGLGFSSRAARYLDQDYVSAVTAQREDATGNLIFTVYQQLPFKIGLFFLFLYVQISLCKRMRALPPGALSLYIFAVEFFAAANVLGSIPSVGRFTVIGTMLVLASLISIACILSRREKVALIIALALVMAWWLAAPVRRAAASVDVYSLLPSPALLIEKKSLIDK